MALLEIEAVSKHFGALAAVEGVSLAIERGAFFALLGPSGCGKTTLLRMIAGFERPDRGQIRIDGKDVTTAPPYARPVNMMFQSYALFPHMDVAGNIAFGLRQEGIERARIAARVAEMLALVEMTDHAHRRPHELSGGQRQRVALARALAKMPKLLLLDEPLAALDRKLRERTRLELIRIQQRVGITFLVVTHDQEEALGMATEIAVMERGRIAQRGPPAEIYRHPASRFVADFVGDVNLLDGTPVTEAGRPGFRVAGLPLPVPLPEISGQPIPDEAAPIALAIRPESLVLSETPPPGFAVPAKIVAIEYLGGGSIVHAMTAEGRELKAALASAAASRLARGDAVWASWSPEDTLVLTR